MIALIALIGRHQSPFLFRISYATSMEQLEEGADRLERFFKKLQESGGTVIYRILGL